jgi:hypothetical protein
MKRLWRAAALVAALSVPFTTPAGAADGRRTSVMSLGPLPPHPVVAELAPRALHDLDRLMAGGLAWFEQADGVRCQGSADELQRASIGPRLFDRARRALEIMAVSPPVPLRVSMIVLSGECPGAGLLSGPLEFILETETRIEVAGTRSDVTQVQHITGFFLDGDPVGEFTISAAVRTKSYMVLSSGEAIEMKTDDQNLRRLYKQVIYSVSYMTLDGDGLLVRPSVAVSQSDMDAATTITVASPVDGRRQIMESYRDGVLNMRSRMMDGLNHGWMETAPGLPRTCFQHGRVMKAEFCPDS